MQDLNDEVVLVEDLAPIINEELVRRTAIFEREWKRVVSDTNRMIFGDKPSDPGSGILPVTPIQSICNEARTNDRTLRRITHREASYVPLDLADRILMAIDRDLWEVEVYKGTDVRRAVTVQTEILREIAPKHGIVIPPATGIKKSQRSNSQIAQFKSKLIRKQESV